jgi:hypothetical protein
VQGEEETRRPHGAGDSGEAAAPAAAAVTAVALLALPFSPFPLFLASCARKLPPDGAELELTLHCVTGLGTVLAMSVDSCNLPVAVAAGSNPIATGMPMMPQST